MYSSRHGPYLFSVFIIIVTINRSLAGCWIKACMRNKSFRNYFTMFNELTVGGLDLKQFFKKDT